MELMQQLENGLDVVITSEVDDAWLTHQIRDLAGAPGHALGEGPVIVLGGRLPRLRRLESGLRAGLTRVHAIRTGAGELLDLADPPKDVDVIVLEQRWLPLLQVAPARAWVVLDDVLLTGEVPQVTALCDARHYAPTVCVCPQDRVADMLNALHLYRPAFIQPNTLRAETHVVDPIKRERPAKVAVARRGEPDVAMQAERAAEAAARQMAPDATQPSTSTEAAAAFETLRAWRAKVARVAGIPAYRILTNKSLQDLIEAKPHTREEFLAIPGIGEKTWESYGFDLIQQLSAAG